MKKTYFIYLIILILAFQGCTMNEYIDKNNRLINNAEADNFTTSDSNLEIDDLILNSESYTQSNNKLEELGTIASTTESTNESILYKTDNGCITWNELENDSLENKNSTIPIRGLPTIIFNDSNNG